VAATRKAAKGREKDADLDDAPPRIVSALTLVECFRKKLFVLLQPNNMVKIQVRLAHIYKM
jgi:hypothetical protein